jgi:hypothetical protein
VSRRDREARQQRLATIDELLAADLGADAPRPPRRQRRVALPWPAATLLLSFAAATGVWLAIRGIGGIAIPFPLLFMVFLAGALLRRAAAAVAGPPLPPALRGHLPAAPREALESHVDGVFLVVNRWETRLEWGGRDAGRFDHLVRRRIADLVDERLRLRHGLTRGADPARARRLVGEQLWAFLHAPAVRPPTPAEMAALVARVEAI